MSEVLAAGWPSVPPTVRDAVTARLARSGPGARRAVEAAAVIGTRLDRALLSAVLAGSFAAVDACVTTGVLVPDGPELRFRHELVRLAVETGIAPHRKAELHAGLLAALEQRGDADPAVLAHHAEGAGDREAVLLHAPVAARRSSALGAHREAAAQFERALRFSDAAGGPVLAGLYEGVAGEYALLDRWPEVEHALNIVLDIRRELGDDLSVGKALSLLSTALWRLCRGDEEMQVLEEAVRVLEALPPGTELAWAYAQLGITYETQGRGDEGVGLIERARAIGERLDRPEIASYTLNALGYVVTRSGRDRMDSLKRALQIGLDADLPEAAGRAYSSLLEVSSDQNLLEECERYYTEGMAYCEDRELGVFSTCMLGWRAYALMLTGRWDEAADLCARRLGNPSISPVNRLNPLRVLGSIRGRRGEAGAQQLLDEALALAEGTADPRWIVPVRMARAELSWISGQSELAVQEIWPGLDQAARRVDEWTLGSLAVWLSRLGAPPGSLTDLAAGPLPSMPEPYGRELAGDWPGAAAAWDRLGRPYEAALARLGGSDEGELRQALEALDGLSAAAAGAAARRRMRELGVKGIPRGPRPATRAAPAGLTAREQEVLALLAEGLANREISRRLVISERTVDHHVSAVLAKIGVTSRTAAAREAARMGIGAST